MESMLEEKVETELGAKVADVKNQLVDRYREFDEQYETSRDKAYAINNRAIEFIQENPAVAIVAAVGVGYVVGRLASRRWII